MWATRPHTGPSFQYALTCGRTWKPSSQYSIAGRRRPGSFLLPNLSRAESKARSVIGVVIDWYPISLTAPSSRKPNPSSASPRTRSAHMSSRTASGARPWKSSTRCTPPTPPTPPTSPTPPTPPTPSPGRKTCIVPKPATPHMSGSTAVCASAQATAASTAFPPSRSTSAPASAASGCGALITPLMVCRRPGRRGPSRPPPSAPAPPGRAAGGCARRGRAGGRRCRNGGSRSREGRGCR